MTKLLSKTVSLKAVGPKKSGQVIEVRAMSVLALIATELRTCSDVSFVPLATKIPVTPAD
jgi:hypothetical protein